MSRHVVYALTAYAIAVVAGYTVLAATGHTQQAGGLVTGAIVVPLAIGAVTVFFL